jgi:hypothetical protein
VSIHRTQSGVFYGCACMCCITFDPYASMHSSTAMHNLSILLERLQINLCRMVPSSEHDPHGFTKSKMCADREPSQRLFDHLNTPTTTHHDHRTKTVKTREEIIASRIHVHNFLLPTNSDNILLLAGTRSTTQRSRILRRMVMRARSGMPTPYK